MLDLAAQPLVAIPVASLAQSRAAVMRDTDDPAPFQEAGFVAGEGLYDAFVERLRQRGLGAPESLDLPTAQAEASAYLLESGWGEVRFEPLGAVLAIDSDRWAEADQGRRLDHPGCDFSTGLLAGFFGRLGDAPLAALEVECRSMVGSTRCRFLLGSAHALEGVYEEVAAGGSYVEAVSG